MSIELAIVLAIVAVATGSTIGVMLVAARKPRQIPVLKTLAAVSHDEIEVAAQRGEFPSKFKPGMRCRVLANPDGAKRPGLYSEVLQPNDEIVICSTYEDRLNRFAVYDINPYGTIDKIKLTCLEPIGFPAITERMKVLYNHVGWYKVLANRACAQFNGKLLEPGDLVRVLEIDTNDPARIATARIEGGQICFINDLYPLAPGDKVKFARAFTPRNLAPALIAFDPGDIASVQGIGGHRSVYLSAAGYKFCVDPHEIDVIRPEPPKVGEYCKVIGNSDYVCDGTSKVQVGDVVLVKSVSNDHALVVNTVAQKCSGHMHVNDLRPIRVGDKMRVLRNRVDARIKSGHHETRPLVPGDEIVVARIYGDSNSLVYEVGVGYNTNYIYMSDIEHV